MTETPRHGPLRSAPSLVGDDQSLIQRLLEGDTEAEQTFSSRYRGLAVGLARGRFGLDTAAAEEVWQEAVVKLWAADFKALRAWRGEGRFSTYLTVIVSRLCLRRRSASVRRDEAPLDAASEIADSAPGPGQQAAQEERRRVLASALAGLSERDRLVLALRYQDGHKPSEIAVLLQLSQGAARKALHDAQKRLRQHLRQTHPELFVARSDLSSDETGGNVSSAGRSHPSGGGE
ncbi:MAG: sigma-70 family RNA polymerase sigma factor [Acidobacteriota bacterium]